MFIQFFFWLAIFVTFSARRCSLRLIEFYTGTTEGENIWRGHLGVIWRRIFCSYHGNKMGGNSPLWPLNTLTPWPPAPPGPPTLWLLWPLSSSGLHYWQRGRWQHIWKIFSPIRAKKWVDTGPSDPWPPIPSGPSVQPALLHKLGFQGKSTPVDKLQRDLLLESTFIHLFRNELLLHCVFWGQPIMLIQVSTSKSHEYW